jgi:hypothetical protein
LKEFLDKIAKFNEMYRLDVKQNPTCPSVQDLLNFRSIIQEELNEIDEIIANYPSKTDIENLTDLSDWHGDMCVYMHTHAHKFGLPMDKILDAIMESNFSKLDNDGKPIYDERGKVLKGPNFYPPEPLIKKILENI